MRTRTKAAFGGGLTAAAALLGIAVAGVATTTAVVALDPLAPAARADGLRAFDDCAELLAWYQDRGVAEVGPYGWAGSVTMDLAYDGVALATTAERAPASAASGEARASSPTGTNTQEADVDEPDVAKTDGRRVVRLTQDGVLVVTDVTGTRPRELGRLRLPGQAAGDDELLLVGEHALVVGGDLAAMPRVNSDSPTDLVAPRAMVLYRPSGTRLVDVDLSDPASPRVAHVDRYQGRLVSARAYDGTIRLVTDTGRPDLTWTFPTGGTGRAVSPREALARNRALVRATTIEDWLPAVVTGGQRRPLVDCADVLHPQKWSGADTLAVTTFPADDVEDRGSVALTADGQVVYSSADRLYVASARWDPSPQPGMPGIVEGDVRRPAPVRTGPAVTDLHAFALDGTTTRYVASGSLAGTLRDRWSLDEQDGVLRAAWTRQTGNRTTNGISTFAERDGVLARVGELADLGIDEQVQSVRWLGDLAVLVTFRQVDPLYTVDLSDPARPRTLGALKIPGYSGYLHPLGDGLLLGLGVDATATGENLGAQAAVFDIADPDHPVRTSRQGFGRETGLPAVEDPRAFTWLPDRRTALTTVQASDGRTRLVALDVSADGGLGTRVLAEDLQGWQVRTLPLADGRVALVDQQAGEQAGEHGEQQVRVLEVG
ncbi:beta-propeller domain-containing protein [Marmoricola sp. RAF53]|uniref:beta-propeller domain-containing protein n=1 Tax=Marmoricola sp. RAF53 TaxID=3233059 RepID=UPI003F999BA7